MSETIVVGYDGKEPSERALDAAIEAVKSAGGRVVAAVVEYMPVDPSMPSMTSLDVMAAAEPPLGPLDEPPPPLQALMDRAKARVDAAGVAGEYMWRFGDPAREIADVAIEQNATKIMIGRDEKGFFGRLLGANVEGELEREAPCEVVVVD